MVTATAVVTGMATETAITMMGMPTGTTTIAITITIITGRSNATLHRLGNFPAMNIVTAHTKAVVADPDILRAVAIATVERTVTDFI